MTVVKTNPAPYEIKFPLVPTLFVEGAKDSLDIIFLEEFARFHGLRINIRPLGPSMHIRSVAQALPEYHPEYYFLIDRDHYDDEFVKKTWRNFPNPDTSNIIIWRRRMLENYFIIPKYLVKCQWKNIELKVSEEELRDRIRQLCQARIYMEAANMTIIHIREELKENWVKKFTHVDEFDTPDNALRKLDELAEFIDQKKKTSKLLNKKTRSGLFKKNLDYITGGRAELEYDFGFWLKMMEGKKMFSSVADYCFKVIDEQNQICQGKDKLKLILKGLARLDMNDQPEDFRELFHLISAKIGED